MVFHEENVIFDTFPAGSGNHIRVDLYSRISMTRHDKNPTYELESADVFYINRAGFIYMFIVFNETQKKRQPGRQSTIIMP